MPITTQTRLHEPATFPSFWRTNGVKQSMDVGSDKYATGYQTTTSFRSRDRLSGDPDSDFEQTSGSRAAFMQELRSHPYDGPGRTSYDNGHEFSTVDYRVRYLSPRASFSRVYPTFEFRYDGCLPVYGSPLGWATTSFPDQNRINLDGSRAIAMLAPTKPEASLAQFIGELREKLPALVGLETYKKGLSTKTLGSEYLNVEFGLKPFISDLQKLAQSVLHMHEMVRKYKEQSGKNIRRKALLSDETGFNIISNAAGLYIAPPRRNGSEVNLQDYFTLESLQRPGTVYEDSRTRAWFSGAFTYHLAEAHNFFGVMDQFEQQANHLLGTRITPDLVWELTPWSWLVDWFWNVGNFLDNVSLLSNDSSVLRYGYVMHESRVTRIGTLSGLTAISGESPSTLSIAYDITRKSRNRATPYGFGVDVGALSPRRWAILGALGMTKGPGNLGL